MSKQQKKITFGESPQINDGLNEYAKQQAAGRVEFRDALSSTPTVPGGSDYDRLAQAFNDFDPTKLQLFAASVAYRLHDSSHDAVRRATANALSDTNGAMDYNEAVSRSLPSVQLLPLIGTAILSKIVGHNTGVAQTTAPNNDSPDEEETKMKLAEFILNRLNSNPRVCGPSPLPPCYSIR